MQTNSYYKDVMDFHLKYNRFVNDYPSIPDENHKEFRIKVIKEEYEELMEAIENDDLEKIVDGAVDLIYATLGVAPTYGFDFHKMWNLVHENNMSKINPRHPNIKLKKPEGWEPPNIKEEIQKQRLQKDEENEN